MSKLSLLFASCTLAISTPAAVAAQTMGDFALSATGGLAAAASGTAEFGVVRGAETSFFSISLGAEYANGSVVLSRGSAEMPAAGTYAITGWEARDRDAQAGTFQALFVAGTPAQPQGVFHGYAGKVRITETRPGRISGTFTMKARGFLAANPDRDGVEVVVHGSFTAYGDQTVAMVTDILPAAAQ